VYLKVGDMNIKDLDSFYIDFSQQIINKADLEDEEKMRETTFTELMGEYLQDADEVEDIISCRHFNKRLGTKVNGYYIDDTGTNIDIFVSIYKSDPKAVVITKADAVTTIERAKRFLNKSLDNYYLELEEANEEYDISHFITHYKKDISKIRIMLLTNGIVKPVNLPDETIEGINVQYQIWDIERLFRLITSGKKREEIVVDVEEVCGRMLPCIFTPIDEGDYDVCLVTIPGDALVKIYGKYGSRLLERNVRTFLQLRGGVNKGIRKTLEDKPEMFLAYNNGISATAAKVDFEDFDEHVKSISKIYDLQIVNGGQTTASLYYGMNKKKGKQIDFSNIYVQAKVTIIKNPAKLEDIVADISNYANSQNKIQQDDLSANDMYHRKLEEYSRTIWAPSKGGGQRQKKWFYERMRGQYIDAKGTVGSTKIFEAEYPADQLFDKTDLAKYINCWAQLPHIVGKGKQYSFNYFKVNIANKMKQLPTQEEFESYIAKAILFKETDNIVKEQKFGGAYKANIVAYTIALLSYKTAQKIDMNFVWKAQCLPGEIKTAVEILSKYVNDYIRKSAGDQNVTQWCKKEECWEGLKKVMVTIPDLSAYFLSSEKYSMTKEESVISINTDLENEMINFIKETDDSFWFTIASWAKDTNNLKPWQRSIAVSLGKLIANEKQPSAKQARQGVKIICEVLSLGFDVPENIAVRAKDMAE
jgi:hypothetical protein